MDAVTFLSALKHSKEQTIIFHHQTDSFSCHKATDTYYQEIVGLIDELIESYSGIYPKPTGYLSEPFVDYTAGLISETPLSANTFKSCMIL